MHTLEQNKEYLSDLISENPADMTSFVLVDPAHIITIGDYIKTPYISIDLAKTKAGDIVSRLDQMSSGKYRIIVFNNIDRISSKKDKSDWESLIITGLKEEKTCVVFTENDGFHGLKEYNVNFSELRVICTCSQYPDYLKTRGNLGWVGLDFSL